MTSTRARERLRQEQEVFELAKLHAVRWFALRLTMGYAVISLLALIALVAGYVVLHPAGYSHSTVTVAATALLVDMLAFVISIFKLVIS
jgi:cytochrome b subunit of formate dehydrogenase